MTTHSGTYSQPQQLGFVTGWFSAWSELQRQDFAPALAQKLQPRVYVNGLIGGLERLGRPPSIFQCQMKLFQEWTDGWSAEQRAELRARLVETDAEFGRRLETALEEAGEDREDREAGEAGEAGERRESGRDSGMSDHSAPDAADEARREAADLAELEADIDQAIEDASIDSQSSELTPTEI